MKTDDIKPGSVYLTRIGGALAAVTVVGEARRRFNYTLAKSTGPARFTVQRVGESSPLPKSRTAAALRPVPEATFHMLDQPWAVLVRRDFGADGLAHAPGHKPYTVRVPDFDFATAIEAKNAAHAAVLAARGMVARAVFGVPASVEAES